MFPLAKYAVRTVNDLHLPQKKTLLYKTHHSTQPVVQLLNFVPKIVQTFGKLESIIQYISFESLAASTIWCNPHLNCGSKDVAKNLEIIQQIPHPFQHIPSNHPGSQDFAEISLHKMASPKRKNPSIGMARLFCLDVRPFFEGLTFKDRCHRGTSV